MDMLGDIRLDRRQFALAGSVAALVGLSPAPSVASQNATAEAGDLASLGLPELKLTVTADAFEGLPDGDLEAGRYLLTATIADGLEYAAAAVVGPPPRMTAEELVGEFQRFAAPSPEGSPAAGQEEGPPSDEVPLWFYQCQLPGGVGGSGGSTLQTVLDLWPGEWVLWGDDPMAAQPPIIFNVTGEMPEDLPVPVADITVTFIDFAITFEGNLTAGDHLAHLQNHGAEPHFALVMKGPDSMTLDDIGTIMQVMMEMEDGGTPPDLPFNPETDLMPVWQTITQSIGTEQWTPLSLDAGTYVAFCFFPNAGEGAPHAAHGMYTVFTVT